MTPLASAHWPAETGSSILELTVGELLQRAAATSPDTDALISVAPDREARIWTYDELLADAEHCSAWLLERYTPGEHVAVWAPNVPEWIVLQYGAALAGLVLVTINPALREAELAYALETSQAVGLFHVDTFRGSDMSAIINQALPGITDVRDVTAFEGWLDEVRATPKRSSLPVVDPRSPTQIQFTSGTTGRPKAAVLRHMSMVTNAVDVRERCESRTGATYGTALPLFHTAGCGLAGMATVYQGATFVLAEVFDPGTVLTAMQDHRVEVFGAVPAMLHAMLAHPLVTETDLSALKVIMSGGDLVPPSLVDGWKKIVDVSFSAVYGQTELSPIVCQTRPSDANADNLNTAGQPLPNVEVAIFDPHTGDVQPPGVEGEICARGYLRMIGYLGMPDETAETIDADGWLRTGDLGTMDDRGYVTVTGRLKDMIIRGGENIFPAEIEEALADHPAVASAIVLGLSDEAWGESVAAVVQLNAANPVPSAHDLHTFLRERLAAHKTPKSWYTTDEPPTNAMGKLQKFRLRERILAGELTAL